MGETKRKIHFLRVDSENRSFGHLLERINQLTGEAMYSRVDTGTGGVYMRSLAHVNDDRYEGSIARLRMDRLPSIAKHGERATQQLDIAIDEGLAECTHFIYFPTTRILAVEYNHYGPRASTMEWFVVDKANDLYGDPPRVTFKHIFDDDTLRRLGDGAVIRLARIAVPKNRVESLSQFDGTLHAAFVNAANFGNEGEIEIILRMSGRDSVPMSGQAFLNKLGRMSGELNDTFTKLKLNVKRGNEPVDHLDLLESKFVVEVTVNTTGRGNEVDTVQIFREMREAYQRRRAELVRMSQYERLD